MNHNFMLLTRVLPDVRGTSLEVLEGTFILLLHLFRVLILV